MTMVLMQPPNGATGTITSRPIAGRTYTCAATAGIQVPDFDVPALRGQGWVQMPNVLPQAVTAS